MMDKTLNNRAWFMVLPVLILVAFNAIIPLMTVVNYSVQETFGGNVFFFSGVTWFQDVLSSERFHAALLRQLAFTFTILFIEIPLGVAIALAMPRKGFWLSLCLVLMALPLLIPWNVVGAIWNIFALPDIGLLGRMLNGLGFTYNYTREPGDAWFTLILMDVWHWTSLVVLLAYAGLSAIPDAFYQAAKIDGASRWAYTEPSVLTGGGPGNATTLLSIDLVKVALGQFDLGRAAAMSIVYFLIVLLLSWVFYTLMMRGEEQS
jgi:glycerol transport system permease protein